MRLLVDGRVLDDRYHGIGRVTSELLPELAASRECDLIVALATNQRSSRFDLSALTTGLGAEVVTMNHDLDSPAQYLAWPRIQRAARADVALFPYNLGAALSGPARRVTIVHDCIMERDARFAPGRKTRTLYRALTAAVVRRNTVLVPSRASAADVERYYRVPVPGSHVLTWGVDPAFARPVVMPAAIGGRALPERYLLHVGARRPHKNVEVLVRALAELQGSDGDRHLVLVGSVDARLPDPVPSLASELGVTDRIVHLPHVTNDELLALYRGADAFVYPSLVEGVGLPLLEAMASGTPVVASDIPVFREVGSDAALFVDPLDPAAWAAAVRRLDAEAERVAFIDAGHAVASSVSWRATGQQLLDILLSR